MTNFIIYSTNIFANIANESIELLKADKHTCYINSITVCNTSDNTITINLTKTLFTGVPKIVYLIKNLEIPPARNGSLSTVDLVKHFGIEIFLPLIIPETAPSVPVIPIASALNIYSGGINQKFDCTIDYSIMTELPLNAVPFLKPNNLF